MTRLNNPEDALRKCYQILLFFLSFDLVDMLFNMWHIPSPTLLLSVVGLVGSYMILYDSPTAFDFYIENPVLRIVGTLILGLGIINFVFELIFTFNPTLGHTPIDELFPTLFAG
jgi:hypothetical protein